MARRACRTPRAACRRPLAACRGRSRTPRAARRALTRTHAHRRYRALFFAGAPAAAERRNLFHCNTKQNFITLRSVAHTLFYNLSIKS